MLLWKKEKLFLPENKFDEKIYQCADVKIAIDKSVH